MNHTPGPWKVEGNRVTAQGQQFAFLQTSASACTLEDWANARLIAVAPELFQALADLIDATPETFDNRHELAAARDAIARATGGQQ